MFSPDKDTIQAFGALLAAQFGTELHKDCREFHWRFWFDLNSTTRINCDCSKPVVNYTVLVPGPVGIQSSTEVYRGANMSRGVQVAAKLISERLLPDSAQAVSDILFKRAEKVATLAMLEKKRDQLQRKYEFMYPFSIESDHKIILKSKYGAKVSFSGYVYAGGDKYRLTSEGSGVRCDDIDTKAGRALLKALSQ